MYGHIRATVRQATNRVKVGVLHVNSTDSKSGIIFLDVLRLKHPNIQKVDPEDPKCSSFES